MRHIPYLLYPLLTRFPVHSKDDSDCIYVDNDTRIQIVETMAFLPRADKEQCAAFVVRLVIPPSLALLFFDLQHSHP